MASSSSTSNTTTTTTTTTVTTTVTVEECFDHYNGFLKREKPALLEIFYKDEAELKKKATIGESMVNALLKEGCGKEVAKDLSILTLYDIVILIDDSSSMRVEETEPSADGKLVHKRIETLQQTLDEITKIYDLTQGSGILSVRFLNGKTGKRNVNNEKAKTLLKDHTYTGVTRIGTELQKKILNRFVWKEPQTMQKPLLVMIITDGAVEGEKSGLLEEVITKCVRDLKAHDRLKEAAVSFHFSRVGNDNGAKELLEQLDNHPEVKDFVDCLPVTARLEDITKPEYRWTVLPKLLVGAIVEDWNVQDETVDHNIEKLAITDDNDVDSDED